MFSSALFKIAQDCEQSRCPSTGKRVKLVPPCHALLLSSEEEPAADTGGNLDGPPENKAEGKIQFPTVRGSMVPFLEHLYFIEV